MPEASASTSAEQVGLGREQIAVQISRVGILMLIIFLLTALGALIPPRLLDPAWQLRVVSVLVGNGTIPLVGYLLLPLAVAVDPSNRRLQARWQKFRTLALLPVIGFGLLIPLQGMAITRGLQNAVLVQNRQLSTASSRLADLRAAVQESTTPAQLSERLKAIKAPGLPPAALNQPMPQLRRELLASLKTAEGQLRQAPTGLSLASLWGLLQNGLREMLTSLLYCFAFACVAYRPTKPLSLWEEWKAAWRNRGRRAQARAKERQEQEAQQAGQRPAKGRRLGLGLPKLGRRNEDRAYLHRLSRRDDD